MNAAYLATWNHFTGRAADAPRDPAELPEKAGKRALAPLWAFQDPDLDDEKPEPKL
jgi:hypothetical protein